MKPINTAQQILIALGVDHATVLLGHHKELSACHTKLDRAASIHRSLPKRPCGKSAPALTVAACATGLQTSSLRHWRIADMRIKDHLIDLIEQPRI
jgi:hypothetical protein